MDKVVQLYKALGDENRLRILNLLRGGELCVCKIMDALSMPQSRASRHLAYLKNAGLVQDRRDGPWIHYSMSEASTPLARKVMETLDLLAGDNPVFASDREKLKNRSGASCAASGISDMET